MVTSHDVARLAGVSQSTVSRALRDASSVSESTKREVRAAAIALGYATNVVGRELATGRSNRVGLVVTDLTNQFYHHLIAPMHDELSRLGYELILISESSESAPVADLVQATGLCGVVLATTTTDSLLPARLRQSRIPFVYFNRIAHGTEADAVTVDPVAGISQLMQVATEKGHKRIGAIFGPQNTSTGISREAAVRDALYDRGITLLSRQVFHGPFDFETGRTATHQLLDQRNPPTLIFCGNDVVALGALHAAGEREIKVPQELSVVGFDNLPSSSWAFVRLATVAFDLNEMSREAIRLLDLRVKGNSDLEPQNTVFPTWYIARDTLGQAPEYA